MTINIKQLKRLAEHPDNKFVSIDSATFLSLIAQIEGLQDICAAAYQLAGVVNAPLRFLDAFGDAASGEIDARLSGVLLPISTEEHGDFVFFRDYPESECTKALEERKLEEMRIANAESAGALYAALRSMHWTDGKLAVVNAKDVQVGVQTYSGERLDAAIAVADTPSAKIALNQA